jgi:hypothetical protein
MMILKFNLEPTGNNNPVGLFFIANGNILINRIIGGILHGQVHRYQILWYTRCLSANE